MTVGYPKYRSAGVEWLDVVPSHWNHVPIRHLFRRVKRTGFGNETLLSVYRDYGVIEKASRTDNFNKASEDLDSYQLVEPGDLAINKMKAWQGSVAISTIRGIVSPAYFIYRPSHDADPRFLHFLFRSGEYVSAYALFSKGVRINQWDLDPEQHLSMTVNLPPLDEQRQIAEYLDRETGKIDELIAKQERLIAKLRERRNSAIGQAVTKGVQNSDPLKPSGDIFIGEIPISWSLVKLSQVFETIGSGTTPPDDEAAYYEGDIPWVTTGELRENVITDTNKKVSSFAIASLSALKIFPAGSLVIAMYGATIGRLGVLGVDATTNQACCVLAQPRNALTGFVYFALQASQERLMVHATGGGQPNINQDTVRKFKIALPPLEDQQRIVDHLTEVTGKIDRLLSRAQDSVTLFRERRAALISAAVTGKIDVRGL
jgi:type I restriction enzyme, S subunit